MYAGSTPVSVALFGRTQYNGGAWFALPLNFKIMITQIDLKAKYWKGAASNYGVMNNYFSEVMPGCAHEMFIDGIVVIKRPYTMFIRLLDPFPFQHYVNSQAKALACGYDDTVIRILRIKEPVDDYDFMHRD